MVSNTIILLQFISLFPAAGADPFAWSMDDVAKLEKAELVIGADLIYDDELSEALLQFIIHLLRPRGTDRGEICMLCMVSFKMNIFPFNL